MENDKKVLSQRRAHHPSDLTMRNVAAGNAGVWPLVFLNVDVGDVREGLIAGGKHEGLAVKFIKQNMGTLYNVWGGESKRSGGGNLM